MRRAVSVPERLPAWTRAPPGALLLWGQSISETPWLSAETVVRPRLCDSTHPGSPLVESPQRRIPRQTTTRRDISPAKLPSCLSPHTRFHTSSHEAASVRTGYGKGEEQWQPRSRPSGSPPGLTPAGVRSSPASPPPLGTGRAKASLARPRPRRCVLTLGLASHMIDPT